MRVVILTWLLVLSGPIIRAQEPFVRVYDGLSSFKFNLTELPSGNLLVPLGKTRAISRMNGSGALLSTHSYWADPIAPLTGLGAFRRFSDNEYVFAAGCRRDSCTSIGSATVPYFHPVIGKVDSMGNILALQQYTLEHGCRNTAGDLFRASDGGVVTWGYQESFFVMKVDSMFEPLWAMRFTSSGGVQFVKELPNGDLLAGMNVASAGAVVVRMDASGNIIWSKSYIRPRGMVHDAVVVSDDSFIITGYTDSTSATNLFEPLPPTFQPKLFMMKLNGAGAVQWCRGYDSAPNYWNTPRPSRIVRTFDSNYAVLATLGYPGSIMFYRPFLMKTDQNGDTLWSRAIGRTGYDHYATDLMVHSDGGLLVSGSVWGDLPNQNSSMPYVLKPDAVGHFPCWERQHPIELVELFPVDSAITLTSVNGASILPAILTDTIFDPVTVFSGCDFSTGMPHSITAKPRLYPNPTPGRFTVEFADPLMADSYYSLFDTMGKLLLQRPLPTGATLEEVDLTRFGAGSYVIKFTSPEGVCYERVVVE